MHHSFSSQLGFELFVPALVALISATLIGLTDSSWWGLLFGTALAITGFVLLFFGETGKTERFYGWNFATVGFGMAAALALFQTFDIWNTTVWQTEIASTVGGYTPSDNTANYLTLVAALLMFGVAAVLAVWASIRAAKADLFIEPCVCAYLAKLTLSAAVFCEVLGALALGGDIFRGAAAALVGAYLAGTSLMLARVGPSKKTG